MQSSFVSNSRKSKYVSKRMKFEKQKIKNDFKKDKCKCNTQKDKKRSFLNNKSLVSEFFLPKKNKKETISPKLEFTNLDF